MKYETVAIPFKQWGNRQVLTRKQLVEEPWLEDFVKRFPNCFERSNLCDVWVYYPEGDAPCP
jgi:hypothetical protein